MSERPETVPVTCQHPSLKGPWQQRRQSSAEAVSLIDLGTVQQVTGDYPAATASYERALLPLARSVGSGFDEADALWELGAVRRLTGDYPAAIACQRQALDLFHHLGDRLGQAWTLDELGRVHLMREARL